MFDHVTIRASDRAASERFYRTLLATLEVDLDHSGEHYAEWRDFSLAQADAAHPVTRRLHIGFVAGSPTEHVHLAFPALANETVDEFHRAVTEAGYRDNGRPGERPEYHPGYYGAFVLDPDGNNVEVVNHNRDARAV